MDNKYDLIIACVGNNELDEGIIDAAYKKSHLLGCKWQVLNVSSNNPIAYSDPKAETLLKKAAILKAEIIHFSSASVSEGIIAHAKTLDNHNQKILFLIGTHRLNRFYDIFRKTVYKNVKIALKDLGIKTKIVLRERDYSKNYIFISPIFNFTDIAGMAEALICIFTAFVISYLVNYFLPLPPQVERTNIYLIYLFACTIPSIRGGLIPGILAAILSVVTIHFFFLQPVKHFYAYNLGDLPNLMAFLIAALAISLIGSGTRSYIIESRQKEAYLNALLNVSETLNRPLSEIEAISYIHQELKRLFATEIAIFTPAFMNSSKLNLAYPEKIEEFSETEKDAFKICHTDYRSSGFLTSSNPDSKWYFEPMMSPTGFQGILAIKLAASPLRYEHNVIGILLGFADLSATIIDRIEHTHTLEENRISIEKEKLRTMILSSVSHDLKTPLASIIGSLDVYHNLADKLTRKDKKSLTKTALEEARRLDSFITNILDMAKLESGSVKFNKAWQQTRALLDKAVDMSVNKLGKRSLNIIGDSYEIEIDHNMMLRALANVFDNISKYTPKDSNVSIKYGPDESGKFSIIIQDNGPGIEENMLESIFNKYTRIKKLDNIIAGTGLGLPISKSIVESHGGSISAHNNKGNPGASFQITLPNYRATT